MDRKQFNGLRGSGLQVPIGSQADQSERMRLALVQEMQAISRELFVRAAGDSISEGMGMLEGPKVVEHFSKMAETCQIAARSYFVGIGVIQLEQPTEPAQQDDGL